MTHRNWWLMVE